jgi:nitrite reductase (NADH) small subunit
VTALDTTRPDDLPTGPLRPDPGTPTPRTVEPADGQSTATTRPFGEATTTRRAGEPEGLVDAGPARQLGEGWTRICPASSLELDRGVRALVDGEAVAVFATSFSGLHAIGDVDPFSGSSVLSRGLVGATVVDDQAVPFVASPLRKQRFDLRNGRSLDDPATSAGCWTARVRDGWVEVGPRVS